MTVTRQGEQFVADFVLPKRRDGLGLLAVVGRAWRTMLPLRAAQLDGADARREAASGAASMTHWSGQSGKPVPRRVRVRLTPFTGRSRWPIMSRPCASAGAASRCSTAISRSSPSTGRPTLDSLPSDFDPGQLVGDPGTAVAFKGPQLRLAGDVDGYRQRQSSGAYGLFGVPRAIVQRRRRHGHRLRAADDGSPNTSPASRRRSSATLTAGLGPSGIGRADHPRRLGRRRHARAPA